ncbi:hypothetical protein LTR74_003507 [Friedmanniomyces endolithicus]|nr:hypothetical protein LTR74_003507 [Friedmanniomyces endolithicus]
MSGNRRRGGMVSMITAGVGVAAEYREHRKEQKQRQLSRENSGQDVQTSQAGPSTSPQPQNIGSSSRSLDAPPIYADLPEGSGNRLLASGGPANDDKKTAHAQYQDDDDDESDDSRSTEDDEEDWQLDEVLPSYEESNPDHRSADELARDVMLTSKAASDVPRIRHALPLPVIIPQRRPRNKTRGFVRAYAPVLADSGIDQATFLSFLDNFYKSSQASPVFTGMWTESEEAGAEQLSRGHGDGRMGGSDGFGRLGGGRRRGGGLIGGLIGAAVSAAQDRGGSGSSSGARELPLGRSGEYEDAYNGRHMQEEQYYDNSPRRVSYDGREDAATDVGAGGYQKFSRRNQRGGGRRPGAVGAVRRLMREDVLYLMVVNMPSEEEMAEARREMGEM